ncbi:MAG: TIGR04283 family arsenosugar biosynthesis glycosyltransferase [Acidisphaera sp.]|nr:TIGR04283 family arsenosugar biosynthesis glycosyltransferase [Acidisphaera sp.]
MRLRQEQNRNLLSIVIPALNAAALLPATLQALAAAEEIVVADGGSTDQTRAVAQALGAHLIATPRGRGVQLAQGVAAARGEWLLLLHADTRLAPGWHAAAQRFMADPANRSRAGFFRFALDAEHRLARRLERVVAWRSRALGLPYGDQGLLIARDFLAAIGGVRPLPLMEDVDLVRRIGRHRLVALDADAVTSDARWRREGWRRRSARNLACLGLYFAGAPPRLIARLYD